MLSYLFAPPPIKASEFLKAAEEGDLDTVKKYCFENQNDEIALNTTTTAGNAFHYAAKCGRKEVIDFLMDKYYGKIILHAVDLRGNTALHVAAKHGQAEAAQTLLIWCIHHNVKNFFDETAEQIAAREGHQDIVKLIQTIPHRKVGVLSGPT